MTSGGRLSNLIIVGYLLCVWVWKGLGGKRLEWSEGVERELRWSGVELEWSQRSEE
jgi:hypothetical protein